MDIHHPKKTDLKEDILYFLCPDQSCNGFTNPEGIRCRRECPSEDKLRMFYYCSECGQVIETSFRELNLVSRMDHRCGKATKGRIGFSKLSIVYNMPK